MGHLLPALGIVVAAAAPVAHGQSPGFSAVDKTNPDLMVLVSKLASPPGGAPEAWNNGLLRSYEKVYGPIDSTPTQWQALVRRALTCDAVGNVDCVTSSLRGIDNQGGIGAIPINRMLEVTRFEATVASIQDRLQAAGQHSAPPKLRAMPESPIEMPTPVPEKSQVVNTPSNQALASPVITSTAPSTIIRDQPAAPVTADSEPASRTPSSWPTILATIFGLAALAAVVRLFYRWRRWRVEDQKSVSASIEGMIKAPEAGADREPIVDPIQASARRLLDALNAAECDVEPFLAFVTVAGIDVTTSEPLATVSKWRDSIRDCRNSMLDTFIQRGWPTELPAATIPQSLGEATERLLRHAAFFTALLQLQKREDSAVHHWSRLMPAAVMRAYWNRQTSIFTGNLKALPMPDLAGAAAPVTLRDSTARPEDFFRKAVKQAIKQ
jgi:hypothetical protein